MHEITKNEFWVFFGMMISARIHGRQGQLWDEEDDEPEGIEEPVNLGHHMLKYRFKEIKKFVPYMWERPELKETDPWWQLSLVEIGCLCLTVEEEKCNRRCRLWGGHRSRKVLQQRRQWMRNRYARPLQQERARY